MSVFAGKCEPTTVTPAPGRPGNGPACTVSDGPGCKYHTRKIITATTTTAAITPMMILALRVTGLLLSNVE
jgi:hypothetical protein